MNDPLLYRLYPDGYEPMDIEKDPTISDCCIKYKNRLNYNLVICNKLYNNPLCGEVKELIILTTETDRRIFKKSKTSKGTRYLVIKGQEILAVYEQFKNEGKHHFYHGYTIPVKWELYSKETIPYLIETYKELIPQLVNRIKNYNKYLFKKGLVNYYHT